MNEGDQGSQLPGKLRGQPWRTHKGDLAQMPPTTLASEELQLLHWLTASYYTGDGLIVDGGCLLGGSTSALASGLAANPGLSGKAKLIHSYDLFNTTTEFFDPAFGVFGLKPGESFLGLYKKNLAPFLDRIEIHEGDLLKQTWDKGKIEILFLDCCKLTTLHDHAVKIWFTQLIPGKSVVIQQDFGWWYYSWGNIMMEVFKDHFVVLDDVPTASRAYLCTKAITEEQAARLTYAGLSGDERLRYMEDSLKTVTRDDFKSRMLVNHALEAHQLGRQELLSKIILSIFASPRADLVNPVVVKLFPEQFAGPPLLPFPAGFDDIRLSLISQTCTQDSIALYGMIYSFQPKRVLEIGRARGGSTVIIASALLHVPGSVFVSIDPNNLDEHSISPKLEENLKDRVVFIHGFSPAENGRAFVAARGKFDFVFIDGNHYYEACVEDIRGVIPYLAEDAVILLHDAFFPGVEDAVATALQMEPSLVDCGLVSTLAYYGSASQMYRGRPQVFGGVQMLRHRKRADPASLVKPVQKSDAQFGEANRKPSTAPGKRSFLKKLRRSIRKRMGRPPE